MILNSRYHVYGIIVSDISLKLDALGYISVAESSIRSFRCISSITFTQCAPKRAESYRIRLNKVQYVVQGHRFWYQSKAHIRLHIDD